ncbi:hypothetical protein JXQ70_12000 [bacterium]|nr:hypothetical protein [bacterium]
MNIPNVPTDNLYKFLALSGTIIVILSLYFPKIKEAEFRDRLIDIKENISILDSKIKDCNSQLEMLKKAVNTKNIDSQEIDKDKIIPNIIDKTIELGNIINLIEIDQIKKSFEVTRIEVLSERLEEILFWRKVTLCIGFLSAFFSYIFWYFRVQKIQDQILKNDLTE